MVDLHSHMLHALDDGSRDLETSVLMARMAVDDGITHTVCTPHASSEYLFDEALIASRLQEFRAALDAAAIPLVVATGCDFHLSYDNLQDALANPRRYTLNQTDYLLIELPDQGIPLNLKDTLYQMSLAGLIPILTHPERNSTLQRRPDMLADWLRQGLLVQITANSITGGMGKQAQAMSRQLLRDRWVNFIATDAHGLKSRPPLMRPAYDAVANDCGADYADLLCVENPTCVFNGQPLPPQEPALNLFETYDSKLMPWWRRLFSK
jgi:protein-tyrosine phosphatase